MDSNIKTPYSYTLDLSVQRELGHGFTFQVAYVGRLAHRLLAQEDLAMPLDPYDKAAGMDYFTAATALAKLYRAGVTTNTFKPSMVSAGVQKYWSDITQPVAPGGSYSIGANSPYGSCASGGLNGTTNPTVLAFDLLCANSLNESLSIEEMDVSGVPDASIGGQNYFYHLGNYTGPNVFYSPQYTSLYGLRTVTNANYNAMEVTLQHKMTHGIQFDFNYTYGKSIDFSSDAERVGSWGGLGGQIINSWDPAAARAVSDFDLRHQFNTNFIVELPFGRNKWIAHDANRLVDAVVGGWQLSGLARWTSGFPVTVDNGGQYPTNYQLEGHADHDRAGADGDLLHWAEQQRRWEYGAEFVCERDRCGEQLRVWLPWRNGRAESIARTGILWGRSGTGEAVEDAVEREPQPAIPMGSVQRDELGAVRCAVGERVRGREFGEWEFGELREFQRDVDESADYAVCVEV